MFKEVVIGFAFVFVVYAHPTMYKYNDNKKLEPDLIPVSSTVIPLPVYQVGFSFKVPTSKNEGLKKPEGPIELLTVHSKKKPIDMKKINQRDISIVKQVNKKEFEN